MNKIKNFFRFALSVIVCIGLQACEEDHTYIDDTDPVISTYQLAGNWQLTKWHGEVLDGSQRYCYLHIDSKDRKFEIYQNFDSSQPRRLTGTFTLKYDEVQGVNIIKGIYDHASGYWNNDYIINDFTSQSMEWIVIGNPEDVSVYTRCDEIPFAVK